MALSVAQVDALLVTFPFFTAGELDVIHDIGMENTGVDSATCYAAMQLELESLSQKLQYCLEQPDIDLLRLPPVIIGYMPQSGPPGTIIQVQGDWFVEVTSVTLGGVACNYVVLSPFQIQVEVPSGGGGVLVVTTPRGVSNAL